MSMTPSNPLTSPLTSPILVSVEKRERKETEVYTVRVSKGSTHKAWQVEDFGLALEIWSTYKHKGFSSKIVNDLGEIVRNS